MKVGVGALALLLALSLPVAAQNAISADNTQDAPKQESKGLLEMLKEAGITVSGYIEMTYNHNLNNPTQADGRANVGHVFDTRHNDFNSNGKLQIQKAVAKDNEVGGTLSLLVGEDATVLDTTFTGGTDTIQVLQAYAEWMIPGGEGLKLKAGRFVTLLGAEVIETPDNWNISRSTMFGFAIPFAHTGVLLSRPFGEQISATLGVVNGWDTWNNNNGGLSVTGQIAVTPDPKWSGSLNFIYGPESADGTAGQSPGDKRWVVDIIASTTMVEKWTFMVNIDIGSEDRAGFGTNAGDDADWMGYAGYIKYDHSKEWWFAARVERFDDSEGARTGASILAGAISSSPINDVAITTATFTAGYRPVDSLELRAEVRFDSASEDIYARQDSSDTASEDSQIVFGAEANWRF